jgi:hypothetical protein
MNAGKKFLATINPRHQHLQIWPIAFCAPSTLQTVFTTIYKFEHFWCFLYSKLTLHNYPNGSAERLSSNVADAICE